jgi:hypothetical protein
MAKKSDYTISDIYQGGYSSLDPSSEEFFTGYHSPAGKLGAPTKPDTANQIQHVNQLLNQGIIPIEVGALQPEVFDQIPKQHFKEINRMAKLTGAEISLHAPLIEPSGIDPEQKRPWDKSYRELAEKQLKEVVERSSEMDDKGGVPITIHCSGIPGTEFIMTPEGKKIERLVAINRETGKMAPLEEEKKFYPGEDLKKGEIYTPEKNLEMINNTEWLNNLTNIETYNKQAEEVMQGALATLAPLISEYEKGEPIEGITPQQGGALQQLEKSNIFIRNLEAGFNSLFSKAYEYGNKETKEELKKISE